MSIYTASIALLAASCFYLPWLLLKFARSRNQDDSVRSRWAYPALATYCLAVVVGYWLTINTGVYTLDNAWYGIAYNVLGLLFMAHIYAVFAAVLLNILWVAFRGHLAPKGPMLLAVNICVPLILVCYGFIAAQRFACAIYPCPGHPPGTSAR